MTAKISTWLITGASSGIGKALALQALQAGHRVIGTSRDVSKAQKACPELSDRGVIWQQLDPGALDASEQFSKCVQDHPVDVLVNNAGYAFLGAVEDTRYVFFFFFFHMRQGTHKHPHPPFLAMVSFFSEHIYPSGRFEKKIPQMSGLLN